MASKRYAVVDKTICVACGACEITCPLGAIKVHKGCFAKVAQDKNDVKSGKINATGQIFSMDVTTSQKQKSEYDTLLSDKKKGRYQLCPYLL